MKTYNDISAELKRKIGSSISGMVDETANKLHLRHDYAETWVFSELTRIMGKVSEKDKADIKQYIMTVYLPLIFGGICFLAGIFVGMN